MPFTIAHPAIILPLTKSGRLSLTALVAGSMAPDFEFFFQMREVENIGHHWYGILLFDLPVAILLCYVFHNLLRNLFITHLPAAFQRRFAPATGFNWNGYASANKFKVILSVIVGIASHILWDGFTHIDGMFAAMIPALHNNTGLSFFDVPVYHFLQLLCSVIGLAVMSVAVYAMPQIKPAGISGYSKWYWPLLIAFVSIIFIIRITFWPQYNTFGGLAIASMGSITYGWLASSIIFNYFLFKN